MPEGRQISPTRSAFLELKDERDLIREGYEFLDEKRMIVAQEMLRRLAAWEALRDEYLSQHKQAVGLLAAAVNRHGFDGLVVYPAARIKQWSQRFDTQRFLGVKLLAADEPEVSRETPALPVVPSAEAYACQRAFTELMKLAGGLAVAHANLERLIREYIRTERRARALENVMLPEIDESLRFVNEQLEAVDLEEALRVRFVGK
ncbi:MAG: V-type ATP synthase subunit D [Gammaproteobacteria bacterium]